MSPEATCANGGRSSTSEMSETVPVFERIIDVLVPVACRCQVWSCALAAAAAAGLEALFNCFCQYDVFCFASESLSASTLEFARALAQ